MKMIKVKIDTLISKLEEIRSIDREGQALVAHCSEGTYRKRIKDPGTFTVEELSRLANKFGIPIQSLFKARVVADE